MARRPPPDLAPGSAAKPAAGEGDESLSEALGSVARRLRAASLQSLSEYDVTPSQLRALRVLRWHQQLRPSELATHLRISPRSATEVVDDLADKGFVLRSPDPSDRRATLVGLTDSGHGLSDRLRTAREEESERVLGRLSAEDREHLGRILRTLRAD